MPAQPRISSPLDFASHASAPGSFPTGSDSKLLWLEMASSSGSIKRLAVMSAALDRHETEF
jgi:hypothetical protein